MHDSCNPKVFKIKLLIYMFFIEVTDMSAKSAILNYMISAIFLDNIFLIDFITVEVSGLIPRQNKKDSAACSTSIPNPSATKRQP